MDKGKIGEINFIPINRLWRVIWNIKKFFGWKLSGGIPVIVTDNVVKDKSTVIYCMPNKKVIKHKLIKCHI